MWLLGRGTLRSRSFDGIGIRIVDLVNINSSVYIYIYTLRTPSVYGYSLIVSFSVCATYTGSDGVHRTTPDMLPTWDKCNEHQQSKTTKKLPRIFRRIASC